MKKLLRVLFFLPVFLLSQCAHSVHDVYVSSFDEYEDLKMAKLIEGRGEQFTILGFSTQTNYVEDAYQDLISHCPKGEVKGISTQFSTSLGFFSWTNKILMKGHCFKA